VLLRSAIVAAVAGTFSVWDAGWHLVVSIAGGIGIGLVVGYGIRRVRRRLDNPPLEVTIAFLTGYVAFMPAAAAGVSGVLAVVTAGVYMGWYTPELTTVQTRLQGQGFWEIVSFLLNVLLFGLVGLQLRPILDDLTSSHESWSAVGDAVAILLAVIVLRLLWIFPAAYLPRWLSRRIRERDPTPPWQQLAFIGWNGMRGAVTIAAALLVPLRTDAGGPLTGRDLVVFFAFCVVLGTLVVQGLSMPAVIHALRLEADDEEDNEEALARVRAAEAALVRLDELEREDWVLPETAERMRGLYRFRIDRFNARTSPDGDGKIEKRSLKYQRLRRDLLDTERRTVVELRNMGEISDEVMRRVARDLDLEESRLS
jgi:CPA1 family monovalent cation:H+ antiporter